jgi:hypothetical protein
MGLYATLKNAPLKCPKCSGKLEDKWQFAFGSVTNLPEYNIGDSIIWGTQSYGVPGASVVYAVAYPIESNGCSQCGYNDFIGLVKILDNIIDSIEFYKFESWVPETQLVGYDKRPGQYIKMKNVKE